ncbi:hypothetical protein BMW23_0986 [Bodo saltans virus]|uniref:Uncharacterized protein n=1 Tax=Bodo saltans virus TaxID=2024608 RepID=A0A2H4UVT5_9VIRU|nr:hypothetical protein QJ851_gp0968 [Bodo saltans virus]ATZ81031.1 hypothetical protein BMW23_0986 [Bodo saltans virus]
MFNYDDDVHAIYNIANITLTSEKNIKSLNVLYYERLYSIQLYDSVNHRSYISMLTREIILNLQFLSHILKNNPECNLHNKMQKFIDKINEKIPLDNIMEIHDLAQKKDSKKYQLLYILSYITFCCMDELIANNNNVNFNEEFENIIDLNHYDTCSLIKNSENGYFYEKHKRLPYHFDMNMNKCILVNDWIENFNNLREYLMTDFVYN